MIKSACLPRLGKDDENPVNFFSLHREVVWVIFCQFRSMPFVVSATVEAVGMWATLALSKRSGMT
ncbi:MAG: hypothetical protein ACLPKB_08575, partial [Xanthobacteraceae bacterium]